MAEKKYILRTWWAAAWIEGGVVVMRRLSGTKDYALRSLTPWFDPISELGRKYGLNHIQERSAVSYVLRCVGKPLSEMEKDMAKRGEVLRKQRQERAKDAREWEALRQRFNNYVIGIDDIDFYESGMSVSLLLNSLRSFEEQRDFVKEYRRDIAACVRDEMPRTKRVSKAARQKALDLLPFCKLANLILTRDNRLLLKFDIKDKICEVLQEEES